MPAKTSRSNKQIQHRYDYRVRVRNFGPIKEGNIQLRPLTVFVGPSNTGKSYLATLIYALHRYFSGSPDKFSYGRLWRYRSSGLIDEKVSGSEIKKDLDAWIAGVEKGSELPLLSERVEGEICSIIEDAKDMAIPIEEEILRCFGAENVSELIRKPSAKTADIIIDLHQQDERPGIQYRLGIRRDDDFKVTGKIIDLKTPFSSLVPSLVDISRLRRLVMPYERSLFGKSDVPYSRFLATLVGLTQDALANSVRRNAYYLPADRTGVMHSHQVVVSALIQRAARAGLRPAIDVPTLSGVLADFLEQLIQMASSRESKRKANGDTLALHMEKTVLRGQVHVDISDANYPHFVYQPKGWKTKLPLMRSSSMVSELAPIVLYLRHIVSPGDILIIEEPESHLHPAMQVEVIRHLAEIVRSGIQVIVTTHSEWILDELANMVLKSQVEESDQVTPSKTKNSLRLRDVGAWLFKLQETSKGVVVEELRTDDTGLYPSGFDRVAVDQHNRWAEIASRIEESRNASD